MLLDLEMPGVSGLEFLEQQMRTDPLPVVVCSGIAQPGATAALRALELGAVEVIPKPSGGIRAILESEDYLVPLVQAASRARPRRPQDSRVVLPLPVRPRSQGASPWAGDVVLVGASTGGTEALRAILSRLPADAPPVAVVQHMPAAYTGPFAQRLDALCAVEVREARHGDELLPGRVLIAPGGRHMEIVGAPGRPRVHLADGDAVSGHRPSVDVLFRSGARALGLRAVGVLLTGMGADGAEGLLALRQAGAFTIAQSEATCVVFGMPGEAVALGAAREVSDLDDIALSILAASGHPRRGPSIRN
jgi:two-component system chemotaxis response regulator CheB